MTQLVTVATLGTSQMRVVKRKARTPETAVAAKPEVAVAMPTTQGEARLSLPPARRMRAQASSHAIFKREDLASTRRGSSSSSLHGRRRSKRR
jgi:hypothetical protein